MLLSSFDFLVYLRSISLVGHNRFGAPVRSFSISLNKLPVESLIRRAHYV